MDTGYGCPLELTPIRDEAYVLDLSLARIDADQYMAVWIERYKGREYVCWRRYENRSLGTVHRIQAVRGHPCAPRCVAERILWREYLDAWGTVYEVALQEDGCRKENPADIVLLNAHNCGEMVCVADRDGTLWLLAETRKNDGIGLRLLKKEKTTNEWRHQYLVGNGCDFCVRPRLCAGTDGVLATWDEYMRGHYRVATQIVSGTGSRPSGVLPVQETAWESLSCAACAKNGVWYVARCRERLIELDGGAANHHSEMVVAVHGNGMWRDVAQVDIDHALNPWMAAYWGLRRFPVLVAGENWVWLLWEEKQDVKAMGPSLGRLCVVKVAADGIEGDPVVLLPDKCMFVVETNPVAPELSVATKTMMKAFEFHLPYELHDLNLAGQAGRRPSDLDSNRNSPAFLVRSFETDRRRLDGTPYNLFFGDPHVHSRLSMDLDGEQDELYHLARDIAGLDFVIFTENDGTRYTEPLAPADWERNRWMADIFNAPGRFTALVGWEYTLHERPGHPESRNSHRSVIFPGNDGPLYSWVDDIAPTPPDLVNRMRGTRALLHHHHPGGFDITDDSLECNIEVCSGWHNCMRMPGFVKNLHALLHKGFKLGFLGASDNHERNPGLGGALTGVWAEKNTRESIFDAFRQRRIFASTGLRPDLRFMVDGVFMGGSGSTSGDPVVWVRVRCGARIRRIEIVRDGGVVNARDYDGCEVEFDWADKECAPGEHFYYVHVIFAGEDKSLPWNLAPAYGIDAWSSPVWVKRCK